MKIGKRHTERIGGRKTDIHRDTERGKRPDMHNTESSRDTERRRKTRTERETDRDRDRDTGVGAEQRQKELKII